MRAYVTDTQVVVCNGGPHTAPSMTGELTEAMKAFVLRFDNGRYRDLCSADTVWCEECGVVPVLERKWCWPCRARLGPSRPSLGLYWETE